MTAPAPLDEHSRRIALRRMKLVASGMLVVALAVFVVARILEPVHPWLGLRSRHRRGLAGRWPGRLVRGHCTLPPTARPADPAHGDHADPEGPGRTYPRKLCPESFPVADRARRPPGGNSAGGPGGGLVEDPDAPPATCAATGRRAGARRRGAAAGRRQGIRAAQRRVPTGSDPARATGRRRPDDRERRRPAPGTAERGDPPDRRCRRRWPRADPGTGPPGKSSLASARRS